MTHYDIMEQLKPDPTIGDYISLAVVDGWTKDKIVTELYNLFLSAQGDNYWDKISKLYDEYMSRYNIGGAVKESPRGKYKKVKEGDARIRAVTYKGKYYKSVSEAARANGTNRDTIYRWMRAWQNV